MSGAGPVVIASVVLAVPVPVESPVTPAVVAWVSPCESVDDALVLVVGALLVGDVPVVSSPLLLPVLTVVVTPAESVPREPSSPQAHRPVPKAIHTGAAAPTHHIRPDCFIPAGDHIVRAAKRPLVAA